MHDTPTHRPAVQREPHVRWGLVAAGAAALLLAALVGRVVLTIVTLD
jgi:hypothetical protein